VRCRGHASSGQVATLPVGADIRWNANATLRAYHEARRQQLTSASGPGGSSETGPLPSISGIFYNHGSLDSCDSIHTKEKVLHAATHASCVRMGIVDASDRRRRRVGGRAGRNAPARAAGAAAVARERAPSLFFREDWKLDPNAPNVNNEREPEHPVN
jgi:hypothetical protein